MIRLAFRVRPADAETVLAELTDLAPTGVEERDLGDTIEYAVYGAEGELPSLPAVRALIGDALVEVVTEQVADDWADRWRQFHEPILIADRLYVRPPWCPPFAEVGGGAAAGGGAGASGVGGESGVGGGAAASGVAGESRVGGGAGAPGAVGESGVGGGAADGGGSRETGAGGGAGAPGAVGETGAGGTGAAPQAPVRDIIELVVDPGRAFGTGAHATTRLCLELLVELADETDAAPGTRGPALDLGSGSGVLAVAAAQLGWDPVHGVDHEEASVAATLENAAANGVTITAERFDLLRQGASGMGAAGEAAAAAGIGGGAGDPSDGGAAEDPSGRRAAGNPSGRGAAAAADPAGGAGSPSDAGGDRSSGEGGERAPLVLANLLRPLLLRVAADGFTGPPPHTLIASGLLVHECDGVAAAFARIGLIEAERRSHGDWAALLLRRE